MLRFYPRAAIQLNSELSQDAFYIFLVCAAKRDFKIRNNK